METDSSALATLFFTLLLASGFVALIVMRARPTQNVASLDSAVLFVDDVIGGVGEDTCVCLVLSGCVRLGFCLQIELKGGITKNAWVKCARFERADDYQAVTGQKVWITFWNVAPGEIQMGALIKSPLKRASSDAGYAGQHKM
ncbi:MAG: hypothetical protein ACD_76C00038G0001 [uncultured bacterium]|nr:MAG: hypothetical protein ACD_76C00038G0001 [uncultured bacterium]HBD05769.1 hypothetical protein [Candidatus Uhrbacteria bacterium]